MKAELLPNGDLKLMMDAAQRRAVKATYEKEYLGSDACLWEVMEGFLANSPYQRIDPSAISALTEAPMLAITDTDGEVLKAWAFMDYQVRSLLEELVNTGEAVLTSGNDGPVVDVFFMDEKRLHVRVPVERTTFTGSGKQVDVKTITFRMWDSVVEITGLARKRERVIGGLQTTPEAMDALCVTWQQFRAKQQHTQTLLDKETEIPVGDEQ